MSSIYNRDKDFFFALGSIVGLTTTQTPIQVQGLKRPYRKTDHPHQSTAEVKNTWICASALWYVFTWSDNKVHELIAVKVLHTSLLNITVVAFKVLPLEAMHQSQRLVHPSIQFWDWFCVMAFRAAVVVLLMSSICLPFIISFIFRSRRKPLGARSGEHGGCSSTVICL
jgi:hypothetical protein